ncbi:hypothetical protein OG948_35275 (plasmid) [Embleya sp. NBC_00888]|uniref:hypothetical protein n=1 Tax=Embleya sp. NBC_00888 TaxID=2975960 RepID=UPI002F916F4A|nr:hypothetical protein OG948_35275 [Embleya sp. NBC_00888]
MTASASAAGPGRAGSHADSARGYLAPAVVDGDDLCRACVVAIRRATRIGNSVALPFHRQLRIHVPGLGLHEAWP